MSIIQKAQDWLGVSRKGFAVIVTGIIVVALIGATTFGISQMGYPSRERLFGLLTLGYASFPLLIAVLPDSVGRAMWLSSLWVMVLAMAYAGDMGPNSHDITAGFLFLAGLWCAAAGWCVLTIKARARVRAIPFLTRFASSAISGIRRHVRISLMGLFKLITAAGLLCTLFAAFHVGIALLLTALANACIAVVAWLTGRNRTLLFSQITVILMLVVFYDTDWGLSDLNPGIFFSWRFFVPACVAQLVTLVLVFAVPYPATSASPNGE